MSRSHGRATAHIFADFAQHLVICMRKVPIYAFLTLLQFIVFMFYTFYVIFGVIFPPFLAQNFSNEVLTAQENQHLECLILTPPILKVEKRRRKNC